jgi:hypothetical protein
MLRITKSLLFYCEYVNYAVYAQFIDIHNINTVYTPIIHVDSHFVCE